MERFPLQLGVVRVFFSFAVVVFLPERLYFKQIMCISDHQEEKGDKDDDNNNNTGLYIAVGAACVLLLGAAIVVGFIVLQKRNNHNNNIPPGGPGHQGPGGNMASPVGGSRGSSHRSSSRHSRSRTLSKGSHRMSKGSRSRSSARRSDHFSKDGVGGNRRQSSASTDRSGLAPSRGSRQESGKSGSSADYSSDPYDV